MDYEDFFAELDTCVPDSQFHPLNVIDIRTRPKSSFTVPDMISQNSINHLTDELIHQPISEPYSCSTSYYTMVTQDSAHTTWHQDYSATSVFYTVLAGEKIFSSNLPRRTSLSSKNGPTPRVTWCKHNNFSQNSENSNFNKTVSFISIFSISNKIHQMLWWSETLLNKRENSYS